MPAASIATIQTFSWLRRLTQSCESIPNVPVIVFEPSALPAQPKPELGMSPSHEKVWPSTGWKALSRTSAVVLQSPISSDETRLKPLSGSVHPNPYVISVRSEVGAAPP